MPSGENLTVRQWAVAVLDRLGVPVTESNIRFMVAWAAAEGGNWHNTAHFNPLGTTLREPGSTSMNSVGVQSYVSWDSGVSATVSMLNQKNMSMIKSALATGAGGQAAVAAVQRSPWGTHSISLANGTTYNPTGGPAGSYTGKPGVTSQGFDYNDPNAAKSSNSNGTGGAAPPPTPAAPAVDDWIAGLDAVLNPKLNNGLNLLGDTAGALQLVAVRGGIAIAGIVFVGAGLMLMFGREIFGAAVYAIPGVGEVAGATTAATGLAKEATGARAATRKARGASTVTRAAGATGRHRAEATS